MHLKEYKKNKALKMLGLLRYEGRSETERLTFVVDEDKIKLTKLLEYNIWYRGDEEELLNFYTKQNLIDYNFEPIYQRGKKDYFWAQSTTENNIKRTHSGQAKNIVDTLVSVVGEPISIKIEGEATDDILQQIIEENDFMSLFKEEQLPLTLVEGWGAYKINWDSDFSDTPLILYYKADAVDFFYKSGRLIGIMYKDYFKDEQGKKYLITETRYLGKDKDTGRRSLFVEKELFEMPGGEEYILPREFEDFPQFKHIQPRVEVEGYGKLLGEPCILYRGDKNEMYGKSIFTGKISMLDDLDQAWSQLANTTRKSTPIEYIDVNFLQRDRKTGMPIAPKSYDRKYTMYVGAPIAESGTRNEPVQVTQPDLRLQEFLSETKELLMNIVSGLMSPATMGIDIAKKDNADAQREKEKVTIFTRKGIVTKQIRIIKNLLEQCLDAYELMHSGVIKNTEPYDITVKFSEFADDSYDSKLAVLGSAFANKIISPEMLISKLYSSDELSEEDKQREIDYIKENSKEPFQDGFNPDGDDSQAVPGGNPFGDEIDEDEDSENLQNSL